MGWGEEEKEGHKNEEEKVDEQEEEADVEWKEAEEEQTGLAQVEGGARVHVNVVVGVASLLVAYRFDVESISFQAGWHFGDFFLKSLQT